MKKIYISADIEGIWGNSNPANTAKNGYLYSEYCTNMMNEVNLVIDLLFQNGVEEVVVNDSHGNMDNLFPSKLDPRAAFVAANGAYKEFGMMEGLDDSFDGAMFIGYHSRCNSPGVMAHTIWGTKNCSRWERTRGKWHKSIVGKRIWSASYLGKW